MKRQSQAGFTAVELLITLFVAAAFLIAGYQLFNVVIKDGGQARAESRAGNVAYDYLRRYAGNATNPCSTQYPLTNSAIQVDGLDSVTITVQISCPGYSITSLSKVDAVIKYNTNPQITTAYSTYVNGSGADTPDNVNGLVGWWKFNGDGKAAIGPTDANITGATPGPGQNSSSNGSYVYNGTASQYTQIPSSFSLGTSNVTISTWVNPATSTDSGAFVKIGSTGYGIGMGSSGFDNSTPGTKLVMLFEGIRWIPTTADVTTGWHHVVMVINSSGVPLAYLDGALVGSYPGANASAPGSSTTYIASANTTRYFNGSVDDTRIYNRVLSASEISTLYSAGAK
ncbi:MAG: Laminin sub protein [Candidatus Saccharibacteria bacterium]|nr:Laminin sub protein [Candidatus Saccharibacteria bacterium]